MTWSIALAGFDFGMAGAAWTAFAYTGRRVRKLRVERDAVRFERIRMLEESRCLESLRLDLLEQKAWLDEDEVRYVTRADLPRCEKCGNPFRQVGPRDYTHTFCPAAT